MATVLHVRGQVLVGPDSVRDDIWVIDGRVSFEAPGPGADVQTIGGWVLPGYVDAHCHVGLDHSGAVDRETAERQAVADRDSGALLLRDAGCPGDTRWIDERDDLPRIIRAGRHIGRTKRYVRNYAHELEPDQVVEYVRREARAGDGWVKLVGDWIDREVGDLAPCWPDETVVAAVAAAHEEGARVTAHCFGEESLRQFAAAGTDGIEHACGLTAETIESFAAQRIAIVPTLVNIDSFPDIAAAAQEKFPRYAAHMVDLHARRFETVAAAHDAGIPIYVGSDAGGTLPHGLAAQEAALLTRAGLSTLEAIGALTWEARSWLGQPGLPEGAPADFVVLDADPRAAVEVLQHPRQIVLRGALVPTG